MHDKNLSSLATEQTRADLSSNSYYQANPQPLTVQMHTGRDHCWPSGGIPLDEVDSRSLSPKQQPREPLSDSRLSAAIAVEVAGDLSESCNCKVQPAASSINMGFGDNWPLKNSIAGAGAGCVSSIVTCPLDVVKTRLQYQGVLAEKYRKSGYTPYTGTINTLRRIVAEEGARGLYRGLTPMLMGYLPTWGIYFAAYESLKRELSPYLSATAVHVLSAMGAGGSTSILTNPIWVLKSRFMTQSNYTEYRYTSIRHAVQMINKAEGWRGFYKGLGSSLLGVTHVAVQFPLYEQLKSIRVDAGHRSQSSQILFASALSKMVASSVTYPHEVIRTRLQNQSKQPYKYTGIIHAARLIYHEEGIWAFYRGLSTNLIRTVPASMVTLLTYELLIRVL